MIVYNNQLMQNESQLWLYMVSNNVPFTRYEDHEAALQIQLHELVEIALEKKEDPIMLLEEILGISYVGGHQAEEIANFLVHTDMRQYAMHQL